MFGGRLIRIDGRQLGIIANDVLFFKVTDPELQQLYKERGSRQFSYIRKDKDKPVIIKNWWLVPESALDESAQLLELAEEVLAQPE